MLIGRFSKPHVDAVVGAADVPRDHRARCEQTKLAADHRRADPPGQRLAHPLADEHAGSTNDASGSSVAMRSRSAGVACVVESVSSSCHP